MRYVADTDHVGLHGVSRRRKSQEALRGFLLTIARYKNPERVKEYFKDHLEKGDYYSEKGHTSGTWLGKAREQLGLENSEAVAEHEFSALANSQHPKTGKKIAVRIKKDRLVAFDMVFSAPKSVSILALTAQDSRLEAAHVRATETAFQEMEKRAATRVRKGLSIRSRKDRTTGNLVAARFTHTSSRALDPQLHTHHVVFNMTYDPVEKRMKALHAYEIYMGSKYLSEVYRNALATQVRALGYEIEEGRHTWRIRGVSDEIETLFSKRSAEINKLAQKLEAETGIRVDGRGRAILSLNSRASKNHEMGEDDLRRFQLAQLTPGQREKLSQLKDKALERSQSQSTNQVHEIDRNNPSSSVGNGHVSQHKSDRAEHPPSAPSKVAQESIQFALDHVFERKSVVRKDDLLAAALKRSAGRTTLPLLEQELTAPRFLHRLGFVMTREEREREVGLVAFIRSGKRQFPALGNAGHLTDQLNSDQKTAASKILGTHDQVVFLRGAAGTGKTYTLQEIVRLSKVPVIVTAPTSGAADKLRQDNFKGAITTQKLILNRDAQKNLSGSLIVVDEAGLLSTKMMASLFKLAKDTKSRILLVGDTRQHNSVEGGDALRLIEGYSVITKAELGKISRQRSEKYRQAIQALSQGHISEGYARLDDLGAIHQSKNEERSVRVASEYVDHIKKGTSTLVVTPTWAEQEDVTHAIRDRLKVAGLIGKNEVTLSVFKSLNFTNVEKRYAPIFEEGSYVSFHRDRGEFKQGQVWEVTGKESNEIQLRNESGENRKIDPKAFAAVFDVVERKETQFTVGDRILMKANYASSSENRIPNGSIHTIQSIDRTGRIELGSGKHLDPDFRHFTHGYAVTSQASQGKDAEHVIVSVNSAAKMAISQNQFYVSSSRGKKSISIYTDDKSQLQKAVERSSSRDLVLEQLVRKGILAERLSKMRVTYERSMEMSRDLIERAFSKFRDQKTKRTPTLTKETTHEQLHELE